MRLSDRAVISREDHPRRTPVSIALPAEDLEHTSFDHSRWNKNGPPIVRTGDHKSDRELATASIPSTARRDSDRDPRDPTLKPWLPSVEEIANHFRTLDELRRRYHLGTP